MSLQDALLLVMNHVVVYVIPIIFTASCTSTGVGTTAVTAVNVFLTVVYHLIRAICFHSFCSRLVLKCTGNNSLFSIESRLNNFKV